MPDKKRIALITAWFPPYQNVATNRMIAFAQHLSEEFQVEVFTLGAKHFTDTWNSDVRVHYSTAGKLNEILKDKQQDSAFIHKLKVASRILLGRIFRNPFKKWKNNALKKLIEVHRENPFDLLISSYSPQEAHLIAIEFQKKFPDIKWVADMRDEMSMNPGLNEQQKKDLRAVELETNKYANALLSVSEPILNDFKKLCPDISNFEEVRNGFSHNFIRDKTFVNKNTVFTIGYFGTFYGSRKPDILMEAIIRLSEKDPDYDFKFEIFGAHKNFNIPGKLSSRVNIYPELTYQQAIEKMAQMDLNILLHPRSKQKGVYSGKLFDYISVQKPVLALVDKEDVAAQLIREFDCGYIGEFSNLKENLNALNRAWQDWKNGIIKFASDENVQSLHRKKQTEKLIRLINKLLLE